MASFEETALVLQEVAQIFSQDDDAQAIREILALQRDIAALREDQQQQLAQTALEWERQEQEAHAQFVHIEPKEEFEHAVETLDTEKFRIAKSINNAEAARQTLERNVGALHAQKALLERADALVHRIDEAERRLAKQSSGAQADALNDAGLREHVAALGPLIKEFEGHRGLGDEAGRLKQLRARLLAPETLREELGQVRRSVEVASFLQFYHWIAPVKWDLPAQTPTATCKGTMRAPHTRAARDPYEFSIDATKYSPTFIANHLWDMMDAC